MNEDLIKKSLELAGYNMLVTSELKMSDRKYINLSRGTTFIKEFSSICNLPLTSYFLNDGEINKNSKTD